jgi:hypothetical protein
MSYVVCSFVKRSKHFDIQYIKNDILNFYGFFYFYFYAAFNWNKHSTTHKFPYGDGLYLRLTQAAYTFIANRLPFSL